MRCVTAERSALLRSQLILLEPLQQKRGVRLHPDHLTDSVLLWLFGSVTFCWSRVGNRTCCSAAQLRVAVDALLAATLADFLARLEAGDAAAHHALFKS